MNVYTYIKSSPFIQKQESFQFWEWVAQGVGMLHGLRVIVMCYGVTYYSSSGEYKTP